MKYIVEDVMRKLTDIRIGLRVNKLRLKGIQIQDTETLALQRAALAKVEQIDQMFDEAQRELQTLKEKMDD